MSLSEVQVHELALVESDSVGAGTVVWAFAHIMKGAIVGSNCKVGDHSFVESGAVVGDRVTIKNNSLIWHGVSIGNDVFIGPNVVFTNDLMPRAHQPSGPEDWVETEVGDGASLGANCTIVCGIRLGAHSMVGAGSVVVDDVADHQLVVGNPARPLGWVCVCGARLAERFVCPRCSRSYQETSSGLSEVDNG